jgi:adenylate cyclase
MISGFRPSVADNERSEARILARLGALATASGDPADAAAFAELVRRLDPAGASYPRRLAAAGQLVNASLALEAVLNNTLDLALGAMSAERGFLMLVGGRRIVAQRNVAEGAATAAAFRATAAAIERAIGYAEVVVAAVEADESLRSRVCVPLSVREHVIGVLAFDSSDESGTIEAGDCESLLAFGRQAALAIENARMFEEERDRLQSLSAHKEFQTNILEAIANGVVTFSPKDSIITTFNRSAEATFGIGADQMLGKPAGALRAVIPDFTELLGTFFASGAVQLGAEVEAMRSDGTELTLEMRLSPLESDTGTGVAMIVTDVTEHRDLEAAHAAELAKAARVGESFSRYLAPHIVKSLMENPSSIQLGGERRRATMLFADIRGFTSIAAHMPVDRVVEILNTYFDEAVKILFAHEGLLDKFYGDGLMAVFGPPRVRAGDAGRAVAAAIALHDIVGRLRTRLDHPLQISIGLATGEVIAGHFGNARRMDYTVIGDAVNLASGLQSAAPPGGIYCDEATIVAAGEISQPVGRVAVRVKGRSELITAYAIFPKPGPVAKAI